MVCLMTTWPSHCHRYTGHCSRLFMPIISVTLTRSRDLCWIFALFFFLFYLSFSTPLPSSFSSSSSSPPHPPLLFLLFLLLLLFTFLLVFLRRLLILLLPPLLFHDLYDPANHYKLFGTNYIYIVHAVSLMWLADSCN